MSSIWKRNLLEKSVAKLQYWCLVTETDEAKGKRETEEEKQKNDQQQ